MPGATIATVDEKKRVRIPDAKPGQQLSVQPQADGSWTLTPVLPAEKLKFPPGSLLKYLTPERDKEQLEILKGCVLGPE